MTACPACNNEAAKWRRYARESTEPSYAMYCRGIARSEAEGAYCYGPRPTREECTGVPPECPNCCRGYLEYATTMSKSGLMAGETN